MDEVMIALFVGPPDSVDRAACLADRAGYSATRMHGARSDAGFVQLFDVLTDPSVDVDSWYARAVDVAVSIMASLDFELVGVTALAW